MELQFKFEESLWWCRAFNVCQGELAGITDVDLPALVMALRHDERAWMVARRLFGIHPVLPFGVDPDDLRVWRPEELGKALGLKRGGIGQEKARVAGIWQALVTQREKATMAEAVAQAKSWAEEGTPPTEEAVAADAVADLEKQVAYEDWGPAATELRAAGFSDKLFTEMKSDDGKKARTPLEIREERAWFLQRVRDMRAPLKDTMAKSLARDLLLTELQIHRLQIIVAGKNPTETKFGVYQQMLLSQQNLYGEQISRLDKIAPWMAKTSAGTSMRQSFSDLARAHQEYYGRKDTRLVDGMFTGQEIQVLFRTPLQRPSVQYYPDIVALVGAARANLWDPNWSPQKQFRAGDWKRLVAGWNSAEQAVREKLTIEGAHRNPDLLGEGPESEYENLYPPVEADEQTKP